MCGAVELGTAAPAAALQYPLLPGARGKYGNEKQ